VTAQFLTLQLTENAGCFVPHLSMEGEAFRLNMKLTLFLLTYLLTLFLLGGGIA
jgi:hypothetical protein